MSVKVLMAGCTKDERARLEVLIRRAMGGRADGGGWGVSLVKVGSQFSVTIDGPEPHLRGLNVVGSEDVLARSIAEKLGGAAPAAAADSPAERTAPPAERGAPAGEARAASPAGSTELPPAGSAGGDQRDVYACERCGFSFAVIYASEPGEPVELAPVACPGCWHVNQVSIAAGAALTGDYRAEPNG